MPARFAAISFAAAALTTFAAAVAPVRAQAVLTIPPASGVYRHLDALASLGLLDTAIVGQRPFSRMRVARFVSEATTKLGRLVPERRALAERLLAAVAADDAPTARFDVRYLKSPARRVPADSLGGIDATINPLAANDNGRRWADGWTASLESVHERSFFDRVGVAIRPRVALFRDSMGTTSVAGRLEAAYATLRLANVVLEAGRDYVAFGQGMHAGLLVSDNAPAFDMVRLAAANPFVLPSVLRALGPTSGSLFVADLGRGQEFPHARLVGYMISFLPTPRFEFGIQVIDHIGGRGAPAASFFERVADAFVLPDVLFLNRSDLAFSNKMAGADFKVRSFDRCFSLYGSGAIDDADYRRLRSTFFQDGGYVVGASASCLDPNNGLAATVEFHSTGIRYYMHEQFTSGITENSTLIGDQLGPRSYGGVARVNVFTASGGEAAVETAVELRSGNQFRYRPTDAQGNGFGFELARSRPPEQRQRVVLDWKSRSATAAGGVSFALRAGAERVHNFGFTAGTRLNLLAGARVEYR